MHYRDFMQKYRPLYAPDGPAAGGGDGAAAAEVAASPTPAAAEAAPAAAAPAVEAAAPAVVAEAAPPKVEAPAAEATLLEAAAVKPEAATEPAKDPKDSPTEAKSDGDKPKAEDVKKEGEGDKPKPEADKEAAKDGKEKTEPTAEAQPPEPVKYEAFKLPEGVKLDDEKFGKFQEVAGKAQIPQDVAQNLLDLYVEERKQDAVRFEQHQRDVWKGLNDTWKSDFRKDPQLGGNREQTTLAMAKAVLEEYGGTPDQVKDLLAHTKANGMGNYVGFIRLLSNIGEALNVFEESDAGANPTPPKIARSRGEKWYGGTMNGKA